MGTPEMPWLTPDRGKRQHLGGDARDDSSVDMDVVVVAVMYVASRVFSESSVIT